MKMARRKPENFKFFKGPFALVAACNHCKHIDKRQKLARPALGKKWGFTAVNELRVAMNQHVRDNHPEVLEGKK
jgi:hypothetical protein